MASNTIIQCTASSSHVMKTYEYDVFVSFRGDTRNNFTNILFGAFGRYGIEAFKDDEDLKKGESLTPELLQAIQGSRIFVVVFSKDYASSTWCLRELAEICNNVTSQRHVLPIFYNVDPSEVRKQNGCYEKAFAQYEERFREDKEKLEEVHRWRESLTHVGNLVGWDIKDEPQYAKIEEIAQNIKEKLGSKFSRLPKDNLVGMESRVEELASHLESDNDVRFVGISGMGGVGKTTLARALYEQISHQYDAHCFIDDVSQTYRKYPGALGVQKLLLSQSLKEKNIEICNISEGTQLVFSRLRNAKGLIVFDDVDQVEQLNIFSGSREFTMLRECLGAGSRVIIVSRDEHILKTHGVDDVYKVEPLNREDAIQLFCRKAFKCNYIISDYEELTHDILWHVQGHPLTIEVIGSYLFGKNISQWRSTLVKLRNNRSENIMDKLRIGFDELDGTSKEIFLDIACLFKNYVEEEYVKEILDIRGFYPDLGLQVLIDKSLITSDDGLIYMHKLLRDLGKYIVREKSPNEPAKWSRLWDIQDLYKVMSDNMEETNIEAIVIPYCPLEFRVKTMTVNALSKMRNLKLLVLPRDITEYSGSLNDLSNELGYLSWPKFPYECLPPCFQPHKLAELRLRGSNIKQLWEGTKALPKLTLLDLSDSKNLIKMQNLGEAINLEILSLSGCIRLKKIDESFGFPKNLTTLILKDCRSLVNLPHFREALNLESIDLEGCTKLRQIDSSIGLLRKLALLNLKDCKSLVSLPNSILELNSLEYLSLFGCSQLYSNYVNWLLPSLTIFSCMRHLDMSFCNLHQVPNAIGNLHSLKWLSLKGNNFAVMPSLKELSKLLHLNLQHCKLLENLPELPSPTDDSSPSFSLASSIDEYVYGLNTFNCPELGKRESCSNMCFPWIMQILKAYHGDLRLSSIIAGSEIPRWFNSEHVCTHNIMRIDASAVMNDNDWIGVACSAIFVARKQRGMAPPKIDQYSDLRIPLFFREDIVTVESDHLWLFYFNRSSLDEFRRYIEFGFKIVGEGYDVEVKKYGYRFVYEKDLQLSNLVMPSETSAIQEIE